MNISEKRREPRRVASGKVRVTFNDPQPFEFEGTLIDVSSSGFRMKHAYTSLRSGQLVKFAHDEAEGHAQVMWNRILTTAIETGFCVVSN